MNLKSEKSIKLETNKIQIFLATYNRPHLIEKVIESILHQSFNSFELVVSDNSTNDETKVIIENKYLDQVKYIRRASTSNDHFNLILKDVDSEYFMIFHDDDIMHFNMLETLFNKIDINKKIIAIGSNARVIKNGKVKRDLFYNTLKTDIIIENRDQMVQAYFKTGIVPFPSYLYRNEVAQRLRFNFEHGGKHCDVAFIMDSLSLGSVIFCACPLMDYYIHPNQDSAHHVFIDRIKLINYISITTSFNRSHKLLKTQRMLNLYAEIKEELLYIKKTIRLKKYYTIIKLIFEVSPFEYFPKILLITIYSLINKAKNGR